MRRAPAVLLLLTACGPELDPPPPPPPVDTCLVTDAPSAVSLEIEVDDPVVDDRLTVTASCTATRIVRNDAITRLRLSACTGTTVSATIAIGSVPSVRLDIDEGDVVAVRYERSQPDGERHRFVMRRDDGSVVAALHTGSAIEDDDFYAPLEFAARPTECPLLPQMCFSAKKNAIVVDGSGPTLVVPTRHAVDEGPVHVRVEQADQLLEQMGCTLPSAWFDFLVTVDR